MPFPDRGSRAVPRVRGSGRWAEKPVAELPLHLGGHRLSLSVGQSSHDVGSSYRELASAR